MIPRDFSRVFPIFRQLQTFFDNYVKSTTFQVFGLFGTVCTVLAALLSRTEIWIFALSVYVLPTICYYVLYQPFSVRAELFSQTDTDGEQEHNGAAGRSNIAILSGGRCAISGRVDISKRMNDFEIQFQCSNDLAVEPRTIPRSELTYDKRENILAGHDINDHKFRFILEVVNIRTDPPSTAEYTLSVVDLYSGREIASIKIVRASFGY